MATKTHKCRKSWPFCFDPIGYEASAMKIAIEIRPGEGGDDAKLLVEDQAAIYLAYAKSNGLACLAEDGSRS